MTRLRLGRRARDESGYTLMELLVVMIILSVVLGALTTLFVNGAKGELEANERFQAQQVARVAVDKLRREVHCADQVAVTGPDEVTIRLPGHCPSAVNGQVTSVVWDTNPVSTTRYELRRAGVRTADYLTSPNVFGYTAPTSTELGKLNVDVRVNVDPNGGSRDWHLQTDVVLRNTTRG